MNDKNTTNVTYTGVTFCGLLTIVFIALKLTGFIKWSWLWVLSPLWIEFLIAIVIILIIFIAAVIVAIKNKPRN